MTTTKRFGIVQANIDEDLRECRLSVKRVGPERERMMAGEVQNCINWALSRCRDKYPDYQIILDGEYE